MTGDPGLLSPPFSIAPPTLVHRQIIPPAVFAAMDATWRKWWFEPRPIRLLELENVFVASEGLVFTDTLDVVAESIREHTPAEIEHARAAVAAARAHRAIPRFGGSALLCRKRGCYNYGHWLGELLPRAWLSRQYDRHPDKVLVQAVAEPLRTVMRQSLRAIGIEDLSCIEAGLDPVMVDRLTLVDGLTDHGTYMSPLVADCFRAIAAPMQPGRASKLVIRRGPDASRSFAEQPAFFARAESLGFTLADPARMAFGDQVAAFKGARRIVGAMGAAMTNIGFASPGAEVVALAPATMPDTFFWLLAGLRRLQYVDVRCELRHPWVGPNAWDAALHVPPAEQDWMLAGQLPPADPSVAHDVRRMSELLVSLFDPDDYRRANPDVASAGLDPLLHFLQSGWREGRNPSRHFDTNRYRDSYPDVAAAQLNPLLHYVRNGVFEGRSAFPVGARAEPG